MHPDHPGDEPVVGSGPQPVAGTVEVEGNYVVDAPQTSTEPVVTPEPIADEVRVSEPEPHVDVANVRRGDACAILTVAGEEHVLTPHDAQSLWRELSAIIPSL